MREAFLPPPTLFLVSTRGIGLSASDDVLPHPSFGPPPPPVLPPLQASGVPPAKSGYSFRSPPPWRSQARDNASIGVSGPLFRRPRSPVSIQPALGAQPPPPPSSPLPLPRSFPPSPPDPRHSL